MPRLILLPLGKKIEISTGTTLLDAIRQAGIEISSPCNGHGRCGKCKVHIDDPPGGWTNQEEHLTTDEFEAGIRLACQVVINKDMQVTLVGNFTQDTRILEGDRIKIGQVAPAVDIQSDNGKPTFHYLHRSPEALTTWRKEFSPKGIAVDLGTTTIVLTLMDLRTGDELATISTVNPQTRYGHDVMTRIQMASTEKGLTQLAMLVSDSLNELIKKVCDDHGYHPREIVDAVIGGNTTMLQIAAAIDPSPLGAVPFAVGIKSGLTYRADQFRLAIHPQARVYVPPVAHAFIGSDISAGLLSVDFFKQDAPMLFIDIGTNGEMALIANGNCMVTSTAAGPAFEGMGIAHGMRASSGAIEMVWYNGDHLTIRTIDDAPAKGICGSGIIDTMAALVQSNVVDPSGRLRDPKESGMQPGPLTERFVLVDKIPSIQLADDVYFTQKDVRQFQLAKSAIQTGIEMLLSAGGVGLHHLEKIVIAGAFGYHLKTESLRKIGIIPQNFKGVIEFRGNTCRTGCALMLMDASTRSDIQEMMKDVTHLALAEKPEFQSRFIENLSF